MRHKTHFAQPPLATSHITTTPDNLEPQHPALSLRRHPPGRLETHNHPTAGDHQPTPPQPYESDGRWDASSSDARNPTLREHLDPSSPSLPLVPAHLPQPGVHPLPRASRLRPDGSRRNRRLGNRNGAMPGNDIGLCLRRRDRPRRDPHRRWHTRRHTPSVHPIRMSRLGHQHRLKRPSTRASGPTLSHAGRPANILKPLHLADDQPSGKDRRRHQRPEQHNGPPPHPPASPPRHRQRLATPDQP
jgi:hypothetical protein